MTAFSRKSRVFSWLFLFAWSPAFAAVAVELAQSVPLETTLQVPGIRPTQQVWLDMIHSAHQSIDLEQFYIESKAGQALEPVLSEIVSAAGRGVRIRFVIDSQFYRIYPEIPNRLAQIPGIGVRTIDFSRTNGVQHSKYFIVDGAQEYIGSANFDWLALTHIHEIGLRLADPDVSRDLQSVFEMDWNSSDPVGRPGLAVTGYPQGFSDSGARAGGPFQLVVSPELGRANSVPDTLGTLLQLIASARKSIQVQMYEYSTKVYRSSTRWRVLDLAIRQASARGVKIQLLVDAISLKAGGADLKSLAQLQGVQVGVVKIPRWSGGDIPHARLIHSKYMVVDGSSAWVGTENWSGSYFTGCRNVGLVFAQPAVVGQLQQVFSRVWNSPYTAH